MHLDFYHAAEHVGEFCGLYADDRIAAYRRKRWTSMSQPPA